VSVAVTSGVFPRGGARLSFAPRAELEGFKLFPQRMESVFRGMAGSLRMRSHLLMMMGNRFSLVSDSVKKMTVSMWLMSSVMRRGRSW
jgi:hypothetical protein